MESELDDELRFHWERETEKLVRAGLERHEAERQARLALGGMDPVKEACREARGIAALETAAQDIRYAMRGMRRRPAFAVAAVLTLGFGTGAVSTVFTVANTMFFRELPVDRPEGVVVVQATRHHGRDMAWVSYPEYAQFRDHAKALEGLAAHYSTAALFVAANGRSQEVNGAVVSANCFSLLGLRPALGRFFAAEEDRVPDRDRVAVVSYGFWKNWLGESPAALGATLKINGTPFTVIGVAPEEFHGLNVIPTEVYIPTMMARLGFRWCEDAFARDCRPFSMIGRLREGYSVEQAREEAATLMPAEWAAAREGETGGVTVTRATGALDNNRSRSGEAQLVELLAGVAGVLLLVCCLNLAGLLIARNRARAREFAIRISLGAGRTRLMGQLIMESLLLAMGGGVVGMLFSLVLTGAMNSSFYSMDPDGRPLFYNLNPEPRVVLAVLAVSMAAGFAAGVLPALKSIRTDAAENLKRQGTAVNSGLEWGRWLAGAQAGVAVALVAVAGLLAASAHSVVGGVDFEASHVALMRLRPLLVSYPPDKAEKYLRAAMERLEAVPGVESASMVGNGAVLLGRASSVSRAERGETGTVRSAYVEIAPRYFETLRTPVLRGREFDRRDTAESPAVAIVNDALARRLWPAGSVVGSSVVVNGRVRQVVGMVKAFGWQLRGEPPEPYVFVPFWQSTAQLDARLCVRVRGDPAVMLPRLAREANRIDPDVPIAQTVTLAQETAGAVSYLRTTGAFASYAAVLAVLLSAIGLYGALAYSVSRRTKEIGIRMAVGAKSGTVLRMIVREGMTAVILGIALGVVEAMAGARVVRHLLYGPGSADVATYAAAVLVVMGTGLVACWVPARRAASVEPMMALREE